MTTYSFGDVLLVPFPFTDQTTTKKRPTIVISAIAIAVGFVTQRAFLLLNMMNL